MGIKPEHGYSRPNAPGKLFYDTAVKAVFYFMISLVVLGLSGLCFVKKCDIQLNNYVKDYIKGDMSMHNIAKITFSEKEKRNWNNIKRAFRLLEGTGRV